MKREMRLLALGVAVLLPATTAIGSDAWPKVAYQPFSLPNGIAPSAVTYVGFYDVPQEVLEMTCWANRIWHPEEGKAYQENAAFAAGFKVSIVLGRPEHEDTLTAVLDVSQSPSFNVSNGWRDTTLIAATVECMRATAGQLAPRVLS